MRFKGGIMDGDPGDYAISTLERCSYRFLQQLAKSMSVPSNFKKTYLAQLIHARVKLTQSDVDAIVTAAKLERHQIAVNKRTSDRKRAGLQGLEISSTNVTCQSPPISSTPKRPHIVLDSPEMGISRKLVRPSTQSPKARGSDRVLRSCNVKTYKRPCYSFMNDMIEIEPQKVSSSKYGPPNVSQVSTHCKRGVGPSLLKYRHGAAGPARGSQHQQMVALRNAMTATPSTVTVIKKRSNGVYTITSPRPKPNGPYMQKIGFRRKDGTITQIDALVQKPGQNSYDFNTPRPQNAQVTIQDIIDGNINAQTVAKPIPEYVLTESLRKYPRQSNIASRMEPCPYPNASRAEPKTISYRSVMRNVNNFPKVTLVANNYSNMPRAVKYNTNYPRAIESNANISRNVSTMTNIRNLSKATKTNRNDYLNMSTVTKSNRNDYPNMSTVTKSNINDYPNMSTVTKSNRNDYLNMSTVTKSNINDYPNMSTVTKSTANNYPKVSIATHSNRNDYLNMSKATKSTNDYPNMSKATKSVANDYSNRSTGTKSNRNDYPNMSNLTDSVTNERHISNVTADVSERSTDRFIANPDIRVYTHKTKFTECNNNSIPFTESSLNYCSVSKFTETVTNSYARFNSIEQESYYENIPSLTDVLPKDVNALAGDFYPHFDPNIAPGLPPFDNVFAKCNAMGKDVTQPLYVQVGEESERTSYPLFAAPDTCMLETLYNFKSQFLVNQSLLQIATNNTKSVFTASVRATAAAASATPGAVGTVPQYAADSEYARAYENRAPPTEQEETLRKGQRALSISESSMDSQDLGTPLTIPEMIEDALELVSQDGDYMERITMEGCFHCVLCSWAGPKFMLDSHLRQEHVHHLHRPRSREWILTYRLGSLARGGAWLSQVAEYRAQLFVLSVKYEDPDCLRATLTTLSSRLDIKTGSITIYNKVNGEPYAWEGEIEELPPTLPYDNYAPGLQLELSRLELLPNSAHLKLVNREFVLTSPTKAIVGRPELDDIHIIVFVKFFD